VPRLLQAVQRGGLEVLEGRVREPGELLVVAGEHHRVAGEVGGAPVMVEVVEIGEQQHGMSLVD
jgi:hypothetical protein